jgi:heme/copper-type cytochrome/quinol oxidase subunit 2
VCTQLCGLGHYTMRAYVPVVTQPEFDQWLRDNASE